MIFGTKVNLRAFSVEDLDFLYRWNNDPEYSGQFEPLERTSREELLKWLSTEKDELWYIIETKDQVKIGQIVGRVKNEKTIEIGYRVIPAARNLGYCTDAVKAFIDHLFSGEVLRVVAESNPKNSASRRVLEKSGFKEVGYKKKALEVNGAWLDAVLYEMIRDNWCRRLDSVEK
ncbi:MAG: GNAT family protein [Candidatus Bathyarchaeota archaeon]|nr:GNAT family protein [Candidatus Bathyarchaeota archaeon]